MFFFSVDLAVGPVHEVRVERSHDSEFPASICWRSSRVSAFFAEVFLCRCASAIRLDRCCRTVSGVP